MYSVSISSLRQRPGVTYAQPCRILVCYCAALSDDGKMVVLDGWTHVKPLFWAPLLPTAHIRIISFVHLTKTDGASCNQGVADVLPRTASKCLRRYLASAPCWPCEERRTCCKHMAIQLHPRLIVTYLRHQRA